MLAGIDECTENVTYNENKTDRIAHYTVRSDPFNLDYNIGCCYSI